MKLLDKINSIFLEEAGPEDYFKDPAWIAVAFERNAYDNTRMPEWFFSAASRQARTHGDVMLMIAGDSALRGEEDVHVLPFDWESYRTYMLKQGARSVEYRMASEHLLCGCWADPDITVFGGAPALMSTLLDEIGGTEVMLNHMRQEFVLGDVESYEKMDAFFHHLLTAARRVD